MNQIRIELTDAQWSKLESEFPDGQGNAPTKYRAEEIARIYLQTAHAGCEFTSPDPGADLAISLGDRKHSFEVKGTRSVTMDWTKLKVSSAQSYRLLVEGMRMLRITSVFGRSPVVHVLLHGLDYELRPEARWSVHPARVTFAEAADVVSGAELT